MGRQGAVLLLTPPRWEPVPPILLFQKEQQQQQQPQCPKQEGGEGYSHHRI